MTITRNSPSARVFLAVACAACTALGGCVTAFDVHRQELEAMHAAGRFDAAAAALDDPAVKARYGQKDVLLYWLDRGAVALANDDAAGALSWLERAESYMEVHREPTAGEALGQWLINDTAAPYYGSSYEELYVNVFKLMAHLEAGAIDGGATVEARRMAGKSDVLRDRYLRTQGLVADRLPATVGGRSPPASSGVYTTAAGEFIDSTLGDFLSAVTFMKSGDRELQRVAARRLMSAIEAQPALQPGVSTDSFASLGELHPREVNVLMVALSGRGPTKVAQRIGPIPVYQWPVYFELPELRGGSEEVAGARLVAEDPGAAGVSSAGAPMAKVEDLRAVAIENFERERPLIYARTLLRSSLKAAGSFAATEAVKNTARRGSDRDLAQFGMILAGLAFVALTEKADLRSWVFLPARADAVLLRLPPGSHRVRAEYLGYDGSLLYAGPWRTVQVDPSVAGSSSSDNHLTTIVEHFWR